MQQTDVFHPPPDPFTLDEVPHLEERAQKQEVDASYHVFGQLRACEGNEKKRVSAAGELDAESVSYLLGGQTKGDLTGRERERGARSDADDETRAGRKTYRDEAERSDQGLYGKAECVGKKEG